MLLHVYALVEIQSKLYTSLTVIYLTVSGYLLFYKL